MVARLYSTAARGEARGPGVACSWTSVDFVPRLQMVVHDYDCADVPCRCFQLTANENKLAGHHSPPARQSLLFLSEGLGHMTCPVFGKKNPHIQDLIPKM